MLNVAFIRSVGVFKWIVRYSTLTLRKHLLKIDSHVRLPTGTRMLLPRHSLSSTEVYVTQGDIEWGAEALFTLFANPDRDFLDIGAHVGYYSCYVSSRVRRVYAFEPDPRNIPSLSENAASAGNVEVLQMAVSSADGSASLHQGAESETSSLATNPTGVSSVQVQIVSIDSFARQRPGIDVCLIKIDAEDHDIEVLEGMEELVLRDQPLLLCECSYIESSVLCARWNYKVFAFTRDRITLKVRLQQFTSPEAEGLWYKMLFLVPPHLIEEFSRRVEAIPLQQPAAQ